MRPHAANRRRRASKAALESSDALLPADTVYPSVVEGKLLALELRQCKPEKCSLELPEGLSEADWIGVGNTLGSIETGLSWWIGDWWQFAEARYYGKRKAIVEAAEWNGPAYQTCVNAANVARRFKSNRRRLLLTFAHHAEVAALHPDDADSLLDWAQETVADTGHARSVRKMREQRWERYHEGEAAKEEPEYAGWQDTRFTAPTGFGVVHLVTEEPTEKPRSVNLTVTTRSFPTALPIKGIKGDTTVVRLTVPEIDNDAQAIGLVMDAVRRGMSAMQISERLRSKLSCIQQFLESEDDATLN